MSGRVASDRAGGAVAPEPAAQSQPVGAHPSRNDPASAYLLGGLDERKAVSIYLKVRACRALIHNMNLPWWAFIRRAQTRWAATGHTLAAREIEEARHIEDQAIWLVEMSGGFIIGREAFRRDSDGSGEAGETHSGSTAGDSAGRTSGIAQTTSEPNP